MAIATTTPETAAAWPELTDEDVVARVLAGERELFELLMRRHNQRLYRVARAVLGGDAETEDVLQEAYVRAFTHLRQFDGRARFSTWLTKIALHEALARRRRGSRFVALDPADAESATPFEIADGGGGPERSAYAGELRGLLERAVGDLPPSLRTVFLLREVEGLDTAETGDCLGLSADAVKVRLHRARAVLRQRLDRELDGATREVFAFPATRCNRVVAAVLARLADRSPD